MAPSKYSGNTLTAVTGLADLQGFPGDGQSCTVKYSKGVG